MDEKTPYMIREFLPSEVTANGISGVYFEEGVIGYYNGIELAFPANAVREILPAEDISEQIEEIIFQPNESLLQH